MDYNQRSIKASENKKQNNALQICKQVQGKSYQANGKDIFQLGGYTGYNG